MSQPTTAVLVRTPSALPGVRYGTIARHADARGSFRELWRRRPTYPGARPVRPGQPVDLGRRRPARPPPPPPPGRPMGRGRRPRVRGARRRPAAAATPPTGRPPRRDPRARRPTTGSYIPTGVAHGFLALEPLDLIYLVTNEYDGTDELGFAWDDSGRRAVAVGGDAGRSADPLRAGPADPTLGPRGATARLNPGCWRESRLVRLRSPTPPSARRPHPSARSPPDRCGSGPKGLAGPGPSRD